ncbi:hypothetical protein [Paenibacillus sp. L3-i20]|uniref:hypothetical protein n=1 Tax=Paenibacillus sp. L3-i20 TaxID=2905833 RepID=UPI001EDE1F87|nr:hypothetical protein [Paenibacillus sp. L3-i20]GKU78498.1 hypothetical protein L3i20_v228950 [Paenibacillus sp. L3-i20]
MGVQEKELAEMKQQLKRLESQIHDLKETKLAKRSLVLTAFLTFIIGFGVVLIVNGVIQFLK